jgi:RNA polymerase sigma-70 factor, ECF subfamily
MAGAKDASLVGANVIGIIMVDRSIMPDDDARGAEFVRLITSYQLDIYLYVHSLLPNPNEAAEVVQETNVILWEKRNQFDTATDFRAWAFQIARYKLLEYRAQRKQKGLCFSDVLIDELALQAPCYVKSDNDLIDRLRRCVAKLTARDRELLSQRYSTLTTCANMAKAIGRPITWVYNALRRIRRELLDCIARYADVRREP